MSRSRKQQRYIGNTKAASEKKWKRHWHKIFRQATRQTIKRLDFIDDDELIMPSEREVADVWDGNKDGKHYFWPKWERLWPGWLERIMRK